MPRWLALPVLLLVGCTREAPKEEPAPQPRAAAPAPPATNTPDAATPSGAPGSAAQAEAMPTLHHGLAWYADAPEPALAAAKAAGKLVLVDLWAAWCHTCLSMREFVLTRANLAGVEERLVLLALDTERAQNAPMLARLPIAAWPTFYLIDGDSRVHGRWVGAASPAQLAAFVRDGLRAYDAERSGALAADDPLALLIAGDRSMAAGRVAEAREAYERALARAPAGWPRRPDALVALAAALRKLAQPEACAELGLRGLSQTGDSASATDFAYHVLDCARALPPHDARASQLRAQVARRLRGLCLQGSARMTPDDRGDACGLWRELAHELGQTAAARRAAEQRLAVLGAAAAGLPDGVALTYDAARADSLVALGRGEEAIALLTARERALPDDYNPPHQLARTLRELGRREQALAALERALAKAQGPRRAGMLGLKVELLVAAGRSGEAKGVLEAQLAAYRALPPGQKQSAREQAVAERLARWDREPH